MLAYLTTQSKIEDYKELLSAGISSEDKAVVHDYFQSEGVVMQSYRSLRDGKAMGTVQCRYLSVKMRWLLWMHWPNLCIRMFLWFVQEDVMLRT